MIIGIDIRVLGNPIKSGVEEYTENLLANMLPLAPDVQFKLFYSSYGRKLPPYDWLYLKNVELYKFKIPNRALFLSSAVFNGPKADSMMGGADVFFSPHFFLTALSSSCRRVTTFHDLSYVHFPEFFSLRKNIWHNFEMNPSWQSRFSDKIIAVSESTGRDLVNIYDVDPLKVEVIHSGISSDIKRPSEGELKNFRTANGLPQKFILSLGKLEPRKNITGLVRAFNIIKRHTRFNDMHLVIAGSKGWLYKDIFKEIERSAYKNKIIYKEHIKDKDRRYYYSLAEAFVYPSFFEGFGFPPLEAIACGTPVVVSNTSSLPEVVGDCGLMIKPQNIDEIADGIVALLDDKKLRGELRDKGLKKVNSFTWTKAAEKTLNCLRDNGHKI